MSYNWQQQPAAYKPLPPVVAGDRVIRGPDWSHGEASNLHWTGTATRRAEDNSKQLSPVTADGGGLGTVWFVRHSGSTHVSWDCNKKRGGQLKEGANLFAAYRMGKDDKYDLKLAPLADDLARLRIAEEKAALAADKIPPQQLHLKNIRSLAADTEYSDVVIVCADQTFPAHKFMLAAQSTVFRAMFRDGMKEGKTNEAEVKDMQPDVLKAILHYIYTGSCVDCSWWPDLAVDLFSAADMYNVQGLKSIAEDYILEQLGGDIDAEEVLRLLVVGHLHSSDKVKEKAVDFVNKNKKKVACTNFWKEMEEKHLKLFIEIIKKIAGFPNDA